MRFPLLIATLIFSATLCHAERDFLTAAEVDQIRLVQEPNERIQLYLAFAKQRVARIGQAIAQEKPGRSVFVHDLLEDFTKVIEAMDTVSDDALRRKRDISIGTQAIAGANKDFLAHLEKIRDSEPKDISRYQFVLDGAIDATRDSMELAQEDLKNRSGQVLSKVDKEQKDREALMRTEDVEAKRTAEKKDKEVEQKRKAPTLRRKGEPAKEP